MSALTKPQAERVYSLLVELCDAPEGWRENFIQTETEDFCREYRFMGSLGFGGKFWRTTNLRPDGTWGEQWFVSFYPEHRNPYRETVAEMANEALWRIQQETGAA